MVARGCNVILYIHRGGHILTALKASNLPFAKPGKAAWQSPSLDPVLEETFRLLFLWDMILNLRLISLRFAYLSRSQPRRFYSMTRSWQRGYNVKRQKKAAPSVKEGSNDEVLLSDIKALQEHLIHHSNGNTVEELDHQTVAVESPTELLPDRFTEIEIEISRLSSTGDGLGTTKDGGHIYVVPFTIPGDRVKAKVIRHVPDSSYSVTDFLQVVKAGPGRDDSRIRCPYFATCAGCQLQMLSYEDQLQHKRSIVEKAYRNFSSLAPDTVPIVQDTIGSPMQYGYRTKLTPHFDTPPRSQVREAQHNDLSIFKSVPPIGFMVKGTRKTLDIEDCPIGTDAVRKGLTLERERVSKEISKYRRGATLLLRESTRRAPTTKKNSDHSGEPNNGVVSGQNARSRGERTCITDSNATAIEYIDDFVFHNTAGAFFQNNNSILPTFTAYIRSCVQSPDTDDQPIEALIDAYCGSGLFTVTLSSIFKASLGIDVSEPSIAAAERNAKANNVKNAKFITADAARLFESVNFDPEKTVVVIDPPRKGCDQQFLDQLLAFGPRRVVYVSCNVHTQARDVGVLVQGKTDLRYEIESLRGFDFFPQTGHVEGVAVLGKVGAATASEEG